MKKRRRAAAIVTAALALLLVGPFGGCVGPDTDDSETHFLTFCHGSCQGDLECLCGVCTKKCADASSCPAMPGSVCDDSCSQSSTSVCDVTCGRDRDCTALGAGFACSDGRCRQSVDAGEAPRPDASEARTEAGAADASPDRSTVTADAGRTDASRIDASRETTSCLAPWKPAATVPMPVDMDPDLVARAAVVIGACWPDDGPDRNTRHLWTARTGNFGLYGRLASQFECVGNGECGCEAVRYCLGYSYALGASGECETRCDGNVWRGCGTAARWTMDCTKLGLTCDLEEACTDGVPELCDAATFVPECTADGRASWCDGGLVLHGPPCESMGLVCNGGTCTGAGNPCRQGTSVGDESLLVTGFGCAPDGMTLDACVNGHRTQIDCGTQGKGFRCQERGLETFCGLAGECSPAAPGRPSPTHPPRCDGNTLTLCNAGRLEHIDCTTLGFEGCDLNRRLGHYGCVDSMRCGNGRLDPGEQCDDGNDDFLDGCAACGWSCTVDDDCRRAGRNPCMKYVCQPDHSCAPSVPEPDGTSCSETNPTYYQSGECLAGVCQLGETCSFTVGTTVHGTQCIDLDGNVCNGMTQCTSPGSPKGECAGTSAPWSLGGSCDQHPGWVCDVNQACVPDKCGNGVVDASTGENCDPPNQGNCGPSCRTTG